MSSFEKKVAKSSLGSRYVTAARATAPAGSASKAVTRSTSTGRFVASKASQKSSRTTEQK